MVQTRSNEGGSTPPDQIAAQLAAIASKLEAIDSLKEDVAALKQQSNLREKFSAGGSRFEDGGSSWKSQHHYRPYNKIDFPVFSGGDPRGWVLKAEKYFKFYQTPEDEKVDVASMYLEGDALDLFGWVSADQHIMFWEDLVHVFQKNFGPAEFQNPD
jgi:hypothetical protein